MPSVCLAGFKDPTNWFKGYEHTYLDRDIRDLGRIGDITPHCMAGILAYNGTMAVSLGDKLRAIPLSTLLS